MKGGATYRILSDQVGSVRLVVDATTGAIAQRIDYDSFGVVTQDTNPDFQPFGFAGGLMDPEMGLVRFGARDYDPRVGRWTSKDPIHFRGNDANLFGYVMSDPVNMIDPSGQYLIPTLRRLLSDLFMPPPLNRDENRDSDGDGLEDWRDPNPHFPAPHGSPADTDGDGIPDYQDPDPLGPVPPPIPFHYLPPPSGNPNSCPADVGLPPAPAPIGVPSGPMPPMPRHRRWP